MTSQRLEAVFPRRAALALVVTALEASTNTARAAELPGFKKDLTSKRKLKIPEEDYSDGPEGLKYYDIVIGTGCACCCVDKTSTTRLLCTQ